MGAPAYTVGFGELEICAMLSRVECCAVCEMKRRDHLENEQCGVPVGEEIQIEESHILVRALTVVKPYERL